MNELHESFLVYCKQGKNSLAVGATSSLVRDSQVIKWRDDILRPFRLKLLLNEIFHLVTFVIEYQR